MSERPESTACDCRPDWVSCFQRDCPRAERLREEYRRAVERAREIAGDPVRGVIVRVGT